MRGYLAIGGLLLAASVCTWSAEWLFVPDEREAPEAVFSVEPGESLHSVSQRLRDAGLIEDHVLFGPRLLVWYARLRGVDRAVKSGEYDLSAALAPATILDRMVQGRVKTYAVTVPEGRRLDEIAALLEQRGIAEAEAFLESARDPELARELGLQDATFEGYLYPETYRFRHGARPREVIEEMYRQFLAAWTPEDERRRAESGLSLHQVVTLASIVEKETAVPEERPLIAAVFRNRLARGMRLQTDPTVIYGLVLRDGSFDGNLRRRDLEDDTPYNTYTRAGLPPGPIASAGIEAIRAVLAPADAGYLYFVSRNDGTHAFSTTLREHNASVDRYQRRIRARN